MRRSPDGGRSFPRCSRSGYRYEVEIKPVLPNRPTTVPTADAETAKSRLLVLDLDASRVPPEGAADRAAYITGAAARIVELIGECGGRCLVDVSPSGGRYVYVLWAQPIRVFELAHLVRAFAARFPVVAPSPMEGLHGQIRGPGSPHKSLPPHRLHGADVQRGGGRGGLRAAVRVGGVGRAAGRVRRRTRPRRTGPARPSP